MKFPEFDEEDWVVAKKDVHEKLTTDIFKDLKTSPELIALPDVPTPTSFAMTKNFYPISIFSNNKQFIIPVKTKQK